MKNIKISKEIFDKLIPHLKPHMKDNCKYCGVKITRDNFGLLSKDITCCNSILCITESVAEEEDVNVAKQDVKGRKKVP